MYIAILTSRQPTLPTGQKLTCFMGQGPQNFFNEAMYVSFPQILCQSPRLFLRKYHLINQELPSRDIHRDLGTDLSWKHHYGCMSSKAYNKTHGPVTSHFQQFKLSRLQKPALQCSCEITIDLLLSGAVSPSGQGYTG